MDKDIEKFLVGQLVFKQLQGKRIKILTIEVKTNYPT
jgi:hypothetical protein